MHENVKNAESLCRPNQAPPHGPHDGTPVQYSPEMSKPYRVTSLHQRRPRWNKQPRLRQLSDAKFYRETKSDLSQTRHDEITSIPDEMFKTRQIDRSCYLYLTDIINMTIHILEFISAHADNTAAAAIRNKCERKWIFHLMIWYKTPNFLDQIKTTPNVF